MQVILLPPYAMHMYAYVIGARELMVRGAYSSKNDLCGLSTINSVGLVYNADAIATCTMHRDTSINDGVREWLSYGSITHLYEHGGILMLVTYAMLGQDAWRSARYVYTNRIYSNIRMDILWSFG